MKKILGIIAVCFTVVIMAASPAAALVTFSASQGNLAAEATFDIVGGQLVVVLTNTSTFDVMVPADLLSAVFFDLASGTLAPISANLTKYGQPGGSVVFFGPDAGGVVGGEWAYATGIAGPNGENTGISSSGFGPFGNPNFGGPNLDPPLAVDGMNYGITSAGDNTTTGNAQVTGGEPIIKNSVTFTLGISGAFSLADISNVSFQYGTDFNEPNIKTPEPGMLALIGMGLFGLSFFRRKN